MSPELDKKLVDSYPILYRDRHKPPRETCMCWGFSCGDGWFGLIDEASRKIEAINKKIADPKQQVVAAQVKEKFGSLRLYTNGCPERHFKKVRSIIDAAEKKSAETCEVCGADGKIAEEERWYQCLCQKCRKAKQDTIKGQSK